MPAALYILPFLTVSATLLIAAEFGKPEKADLHPQAPLFISADSDRGPLVSLGRPFTPLQCRRPDSTSLLFRRRYGPDVPGESESLQSRACSFPAWASGLWVSLSLPCRFLRRRCGHCSASSTDGSGVLHAYQLRPWNNAAAGAVLYACHFVHGGFRRFRRRVGELWPAAFTSCDCRGSALLYIGYAPGGQPFLEALPLPPHQSCLLLQRPVLPRPGSELLSIFSA